MELKENPKLDFASPCESCGSEEKMGTQKISVSDHMNGLQYRTEKSDSFVIDMETFSQAANKDINQNSRITLQRSLSRKGSQRSEKKIINSNGTVNDRDSLVATSSPRGSGTPEKPAVVAVGATDHASSPQVHHQITITTSNITTANESRFALRRNSFKRSPSWVLDPKRVLFFFATLSSMGTILLIYFTLSIGKTNGDGNDLE